MSPTGPGIGVGVASTLGSRWQLDGPTLGAVPLEANRTRFVVWAPSSDRVHVRLLGPTSAIEDLEPIGGGYHAVVVGQCGPGSRYRFVLDGGRRAGGPRRRGASPKGCTDPLKWSIWVITAGKTSGYHARALWQYVIYEFHVGTFSPQGTFDAAIGALDELVELGVNAVEPMPVAQFPGSRNWGYDGVFPFAVQSTYGGPGALQRFVDACHQRQLAVVLDVVYNHLGPEGDVLPEYGPYLTDRYRTPWGAAVNFDGAGSDDVRAFFLQNARQWFVDFHVDALRLDAIHGIVDYTARPFLAELAQNAAELGARLGRPCS